MCTRAANAHQRDVPEEGGGTRTVTMRDSVSKPREVADEIPLGGPDPNLVKHDQTRATARADDLLQVHFITSKFEDVSGLVILSVTNRHCDLIPFIKFIRKPNLLKTV